LLWRERGRPSAAPNPFHPVDEEQKSREHKGQHWEREDPVSPSPPPFEIGPWAREVSQDIDIREIGAGDQRRCAKRGPLTQA
jgi:hypothetical protein